MEPDLDRAREEAVSWRIRLREADAEAETWEQFTNWLGRSPENNRAYDEIARLDQQLDEFEQDELVPAAIADDVRAPRWGGRRTFLGGMAAAASILVAVLVARPFLAPNDTAYTVATRAGEQRVVALADGSRITLNGASAVVLDGADARLATLVRGEVLFRIVHRPDRSFRVNAGGFALTDLGTDFVVQRNRNGFRIEVAAGSVGLSRGGQQLVLGPGSAANFGGESVRLERKDPALIATWANGYLSYADAPLADVARDLARATGEQVSVSNRAANGRFTGTIRLDRDRRRLFATVGAVAGIPVRKTDTGWILGEGSRPVDKTIGAEPR